MVTRYLILSLIVVHAACTIIDESDLRLANKRGLGVRTYPGSPDFIGEYRPTHYFISERYGLKICYIPFSPIPEIDDVIYDLTDRAAQVQADAIVGFETDNSDVFHCMLFSIPRARASGMAVKLKEINLSGAAKTP